MISHTTGDVQVGHTANMDRAYKMDRWFDIGTT